MRFHEVVHDIYFDDLDAFQVLHNARYLLLFERAIGAFWRHLGFGTLLDAQRDPDQFHLVRSNHVEYKRPVFGAGTVRVRVWVEHLGATSLRFGFRMLPMDEDVEYASGSRVVVRVDPGTLRPTPWTELTRSKLAPYQDSTPKG